MDDVVDGWEMTAGTVTAPTRRLCMCPLGCFHEVFGEEVFCDFCNAEDECECAGEDAGLDRPCCAGSDDDEPDDAGEGWPWPWASRAARGAYSAQR